MDGGSWDRTLGDTDFSRRLTRFCGWIRLLGFYYGDSGIFVRRSVYEALGGFRPISVMEDWDFVRLPERFGRTCCIKGSPACHIIAALREATSCGDRLRVVSDTCAVLARRITRPASRNLSNPGTTAADPKVEDLVPITRRRWRCDKAACRALLSVRHRAEPLTRGWPVARRLANKPALTLISRVSAGTGRVSAPSPAENSPSDGSGSRTPLHAQSRRSSGLHFSGAPSHAELAFS